MVGMIELFSFVNVLREDFEAFMRGVSIEYGSKIKFQVDVSQLMGHSKKRKRHWKLFLASPPKKR
jgi:hypothetical protein